MKISATRMQEAKQKQKAELLENLFRHGGNLNRNALTILKENMVDLFRDHRYYDVQVSNAIALLTIQLEYQYGDLEDISRSVAIAEPVCHRLLFEGVNDYYDMRLAVPFIIYTNSYEDAKDLMELALKKLDSLSKKDQPVLPDEDDEENDDCDEGCDGDCNEEWNKIVEKIKFALSGNMLRRLLLQKYSKYSAYMEPVLVGYNAEDIFQQEFENVIAYCSKNKLETHKIAYEIRRACFFDDRELILKYIDYLDEKGKGSEGFYNVMLEELNEYGLEQKIFKERRG